MHYSYTVYPTAQEKLKETGILERITKAQKNHELSIQGYIPYTELPSFFQEMRERKIFEYLHIDERRHYQETMNRLYQSPETADWTCKRSDGMTITEPLEHEDILNLSGWWSMQILEPQDIFAYERFGFSNLTDFTGSVAAAVNQRLYGTNREGHVWHTNVTPDSLVLETEIKGNMHADLYMQRTDITAYETIDPFGNSVSYRPVFDADRMVVAAHHSVEDSLLIGILKWVNQAGIKPHTLENRAHETITWAHSLGQGGGSCAEHFFGAPNMFRLHAAYHHSELPHLDSNGCSNQPSHDTLAAGENHWYGLYVGDNHEFVIAHESIKSEPAQPKQVAMRFFPQEADNLILGLFYQTARGLGRTSARQLISVLEYHFSEKCHEDKSHR